MSPAFRQRRVRSPLLNAVIEISRQITVANVRMMTLTGAPTEILIYILSELDGKDLSSVSQTCRHLNSVCKVDSLWEPLCKPLETHAPFASWHDLYVATLHKWGWLAGIWCGDSRFVGKSHGITGVEIRAHDGLSL